MSKTQKTASASELANAISTGTISAGDALPKIRNLLQSEDGGETVRREIYSSLRSLVWNMVASREAGPAAAEWADTILRVRSLLRRESSPHAEHMTVLSDMLEQSVRFADTHRLNDIMGRKHSAAIVRLLGHRDEEIARREIARSTGLREANLSRTLLTLASAGLISRTSRGREVFVRLTAEGRERFAELAAAANDGSIAVGANATASAKASIEDIWNTNDCAIALVDRENGLVQCSPLFASLLGQPDTASLRGIRPERIRELLIRKGVGLSTERFMKAVGIECRLTDGRTITMAEHRTDSGSLWVGSDVTFYRSGNAHWDRAREIFSGLSFSWEDPAPSSYSPDSNTTEESWINSMVSLISHMLADGGREKDIQELLLSTAELATVERLLVRDVVIPERNPHSGRESLECDFDPVLVVEDVVKRVDPLFKKRGIDISAPGIPASNNTNRLVNGNPFIARALVFAALSQLAEWHPGSSTMAISYRGEEKLFHIKIEAIAKGGAAASRTRKATSSKSGDWKYVVEVAQRFGYMASSHRNPIAHDKMFVDVVLPKNPAETMPARTTVAVSPSVVSSRK